MPFIKLIFSFSLLFLLSFFIKTCENNASRCWGEVDKSYTLGLENKLVPPPPEGIRPGMKREARPPSDSGLCVEGSAFQKPSHASEGYVQLVIAANGQKCPRHPSIRKGLSDNVWHIQGMLGGGGLTLRRGWKTATSVCCLRTAPTYTAA